MGFSLTQLLIVLAIVALLFGTKKLRNIGGDLGGAIKGFKKAMNEDDNKNLEQKEQAKTDIIEGKAEKVEDKNDKA